MDAEDQGAALADDNPDPRIDDRRTAGCTQANVRAAMLVDVVV